GNWRHRWVQARSPPATRRVLAGEPAPRCVPDLQRLFRCDLAWCTSCAATPHGQSKAGDIQCSSYQGNAVLWNPDPLCFALDGGVSVVENSTVPAYAIHFGEVRHVSKDRARIR